MVRFQNNSGNISLSPEVFTTLVGEAATSCFGVKGMAMRSVTDGLVHLLKRESMHKGVYIKYSESSSVSIELHIIVDDGVNLPALCRSIISEVRYKVSEATGVTVERVDVFVDSISKD
ncbi:MAG: Asp23/Gls24 family envelope stress response protein [Oscillospiraceae bacterium]|nr:Asp23/Gls24 family envelope stress response protein [Oscillospiraceae bacterium]